MSGCLSSGLFCLNSSKQLKGRLSDDGTLNLGNITLSFKFNNTTEYPHLYGFTSSTLASTQGIINALLTAVAWLPLDHHSISSSELNIEMGKSLAGGSLKSASHVCCGFGFLAFSYDLYYNSL